VEEVGEPVGGALEGALDGKVVRLRGIRLNRGPEPPEGSRSSGAEGKLRRKIRVRCGPHPVFSRWRRISHEAIRQCCEEKTTEHHPSWGEGCPIRHTSGETCVGQEEAEPGGERIDEVPEAPRTPIGKSGEYMVTDGQGDEAGQPDRRRQEEPHPASLLLSDHGAITSKA
jgi:hypothetical protein